MSQTEPRLRVVFAVPDPDRPAGGGTGGPRRRAVELEVATLDTPIVLVTGTIGAGKSELVEAISDVLDERGLHHAFIELDGLGQLYPPPDPRNDPFNMDLQIRNFASVLPHLIEAGARYLVLGATIERPEQLERLRAATGATDLTVVLVKASPETVRDRIIERETGSRLVESFLKRTEKLARKIEKFGMHDLAVLNEGRPIEEVAAEVVAYLRW
ncbi:MAG: AAA family ATPase [Actinobacteria bacterium]|nr:AAA family ATPase [Actinomycetota bacterium]